MSRILVIGGAGYVGTALTKRLIAIGHDVTVYDTYWYKTVVPESTQVVGDVRDLKSVREALRGQEIVIHLACISNDPSAELSRELTFAVNYHFFPELLAAVAEAGVSHFIYASSSSVYGVQPGSVTEDSECAPLTLYSKLKLECEKAMRCWRRGTGWTILRPATVCGWSDRMRLDLVVNALTASAVRTSSVAIHGGAQMRASVHISDMVDAYIRAIEAGPKQQTYNIGAENHSVEGYACLVAEAMAFPVHLKREETKDPRSYSIDSRKARLELGWTPRKTAKDAAKEICRAILERRDWDWDSSLFYNVKRMKELEL